MSNNNNAPRGLVPYKYDPSLIRTCYFKGGANTFIGDPVKADVSQESSAIVQNISAGHFAVERFATPGTDVPAGVMVAPPFILSPNSDSTVLYAKASTATLVTICQDPHAWYIAQADDATITYALVGYNCNLVMGSGNTSTGISGCQLDASTAATTNSLDVHVHEIYRVPGNELGAYCKFLISFNKHYDDFGRTGVS